jgi:hypothetical protein
LTLENGTEELPRNDILATADYGRLGGIFAADIESSRERRSISPTLKDESVTNAVFWYFGSIFARVVLYNTI